MEQVRCATCPSPTSKAVLSTMARMRSGTTSTSSISALRPTTRNSSPPQRTITSELRQAFSRMLRTRCSTRSPAAWPQVSLMGLNKSRSTMMKTSGFVSSRPPASEPRTSAAALSSWLRWMRATSLATSSNRKRRFRRPVRDCFGSLGQFHADQFAHPSLFHRHTVKHISFGDCPLVMRDNDELALPDETVEHTNKSIDVCFVECRIHFVEHAEWTRPHHVNREK